MWNVASDRLGHVQPVCLTVSSDGRLGHCIAIRFIAPVLVSELASEGASGRLLCQVRGSYVTASFWPFTTDTSILTGKVSGPPSDFCNGVTETCHENVTVPKIDQLFWSFATRICILSSDFGVVT